MTAGVTAATAAVLLVAGATVAAALAVAALVPAAAVDVRERRLPDGWVLAAAVVLVTTGILAWAVVGTAPDGVLRSALLGAVVMTTPLLAVHLLSPTAMGFGDVKAAVVLGAAVGTADWRIALVALALASGTAAVTGLARRSAAVPFGPFLVGGAAAALVLGATIGSALTGGGL